MRSAWVLVIGAMLVGGCASPTSPTSSTTGGSTSSTVAPTSAAVLPPFANVTPLLKTYHQSFDFTLTESIGLGSRGTNCVQLSSDGDGNLTIRKGTFDAVWSAQSPADLSLQLVTEERTGLLTSPASSSPMLVTFQNLTSTQAVHPGVTFSLQNVRPAGASVNQAATVTLDMTYTGGTIKADLGSCTFN